MNRRQLSTFQSPKDHAKSPKFKVVMHECEYLHLCCWILKEEHLETGGDLFGLWADEETAVIQLVLGPGRKCRRTSVSFYQDIEYLSVIGSHLTSKEGICHIGEWHSHHQLGLFEPSGGDESTVWDNMPAYHLQRFLLFIANIEHNNTYGITATVSCFLFEIDLKTGKKKPVIKGQFELIGSESPVRLKLQSDDNPVYEEFSQMCECENAIDDLRKLKLEQTKKFVYRKMALVGARKQENKRRGKPKAKK